MKKLFARNEIFFIRTCISVSRNCVNYQVSRKSTFFARSEWHGNTVDIAGQLLMARRGRLASICDPAGEMICKPPLCIHTKFLYVQIFNAGPFVHPTTRRESSGFRLESHVLDCARDINKINRRRCWYWDRNRQIFRSDF